MYFLDQYPNFTDKIWPNRTYSFSKILPAAISYLKSVDGSDLFILAEYFLQLRGIVRIYVFNFLQIMITFFVSQILLKYFSTFLMHIDYNILEGILVWRLQKQYTVQRTPPPPEPNPKTTTGILKHMQHITAYNTFSNMSHSQVTDTAYSLAIMLTLSLA